MPAFDFVLAGRYRLIAPLGEGGMAAVYRARDLRLNRDVAIKLLHDDLRGDPGFLERFEREALFVASLSHPHIVPVYDVGEEGGTHFIVMEYIRGRTLRDAIDASGRLAPDRAVAIMLQVLDGLAHAHQQNLVHRDVKPQNILLTVDGSPKLADFGIARLASTPATRTAVILGSAQYLSPEQSRGEEATPRSDIYACGIVLWEMLVGEPPFAGANALAIAHQHLNTPPPPLRPLAPEVSAGLEDAVKRALSKSPDDRFPDAGAFAAALNATVLAQEATAIQRVAVEPATTAAMVQRRDPLGEQQERLSFRRSARKSYVMGAILALIVGAAAYLAGLPLWGNHALPAYPSPPYALLPALLAALVLASWTSTRSWLYTLDDNAAVVQWGLIAHHRFGVPLRTIVTLELKQSVIDRLMGVGTIELCARDQHGVERRVVMEDLSRPRQTYDELVRLLGRAGRNRPSSRAE